MENRVTRQDLRNAFDAMIRVLSRVPNVTGTMLAFDGSAEDIERFGYFFEEGLLPERFSDTMHAGWYILAGVLRNELGFEWSGETSLMQSKYGVAVNLADVIPNEAEGLHSLFDAVDECFDSTKIAISRMGAGPVEQGPNGPL